MTESRANTGPSSGRRSHSLDDVRETYADQADQMDRFRWLNHLFTGRYRQRLFGRAQGRVLDVACGTGLNARYLPDATTYVGIDASPDMLTKARHRVGAWDRVEGLYEMDAQALEFPDDSFDTVVSSLSTCTFPDPVAALNEMARVCKPEGRVLLLEHGRSSVGPLARFQDWRADAHYEKHSCRWNQEPLALFEGTDLVVHHASTALLGVITAIEAAPSR
ncbi:type 11 methyltransferase [Halobacterium sp. DL1]|jgi:ubiquinone/menaquinone biosynthesis C-methylase UbiE|nr:type 11 methyltransferase [Halobacterium sp. DL1]